MYLKKPAGSTAPTSYHVHQPGSVRRPGANAVSLEALNIFLVASVSAAGSGGASDAVGPSVVPSPRLHKGLIDAGFDVALWLAAN